MKKTAEWYEIHNLIPDGTWYNHANEWWLESPSSIFTLRVSKLGEKVDWWMYRNSSPWLSGQFFTSYESLLGQDAQLFDMVINDYESKAWGLDDLVMSDPYRYSKRSVRKRAGKSGQRTIKKRTAMKTNLFQQYELDALLGEFADDFDIDGIIEEATTVDRDGDRIWTAFGDDLYRIIEKHDMSNYAKREEAKMGKSKAGRAARETIASRLKRATRDWAYEIEDGVRYDMHSWNDIEDEDEFRERVEAYVTQWIDDSLIYTDDIIDLLKEYGGTHDLEQLFFDEFFNDFLDDIYSEIDYESLWDEYTQGRDNNDDFHEATMTTKRRKAPSLLRRSASTYQDALNLPAYNMDAYIQSAADCVNAVFSGAELLEQAASWAEYNADGPSMEFADKIGDIASEAYVIGKDFADAWDAGARSAGRKLAFDDAPEYAIADKYRDFDDALQYVNMSDDEIIRESAKHAAYEWFSWSGSFKSISDSHFQMVVWNGIDRVARNIFSAQERVKIGVVTNDDWRALKSADPEAWETLRDNLGIKIDERCAAIEPIVSRLLLDVIEDCRARIESI